MAALGGGWVVVQVLEECRDGLSSFRLIAVDGREDSQSDGVAAACWPHEDEARNLEQFLAGLKFPH